MEMRIKLHNTAVVQEDRGHFEDQKFCHKLKFTDMMSISAKLVELTSV